MIADMKKQPHLSIVFLEHPGWLQIILHNCVKSPLRIIRLLHSRVPELKDGQLFNRLVSSLKMYQH